MPDSLFSPPPSDLPPQASVVLYTYALRGALTLLARVATGLRALRRHYASPGRLLLIVDLGESCAPDVWHCAATGGRSMLLGLDAIGYDAAVAYIPPPERARLADALTGVAIVDAAASYTRDSVRVALSADPAFTGVQIVAQPDDAPRRVERSEAGAVFYPPRVAAGTLGVLWWHGDTDRWGSDAYTLAATAPPDAGIAGIIDFIEREARRYARRDDG